ncbi:hypothetical protein JCM11491_002316 [Sporobolomyces phaffii]
MSTAKRTVVGSLQPRKKPVATSSPATEPASKKRALATASPPATRSTRSTGQATHYQALQGAPEHKKPATAAKGKAKQYVETSDESETDDDLMMKPVTTPKKLVKAATKPQRSYLPSPARSTTSAPSPSRAGLDSDSGSDEDLAEKMSTDSPKRKRDTPAASTSRQLLTPQTTPSKKRVASAAPKTSSPLKQSATPSKRPRTSAALTDSEEEEEDEESKRATPRKTPTKPKPAATTPSKATPTTPRTVRTTPSVTPSRSSLRKQRLPPNLDEIKNAPASLRSRLVGFHMEDEGYGVQVAGAKKDDDEEEEEDEEDGKEEEKEDLETKEERRKAKGKGRATEAEHDEPEAMQVDVEESDPFLVVPSSEQALTLEGDYTLPTPPAIVTSTTPDSASTEYTSSFLRKHVQRQLSVLTGTTLPEAALPSDASVPSFDRSKGVIGYPFLEGGYSEWEKPLRGCLDEVVTRGMGNAVVLLGPRGVGKTMLIERTLRVMRFVHGDQHDFVTVKLSGLVHTTDRLALRSIAMQMREQGFKGVGEADQDADEGDYSSNSATMSTLLRLLEPSSSSPPGSAAADETSKPIILVVDEFDLFALHPRQSFLYCLLDIVQGNRRRGGVGVVGVSSRVDCLSLLEKRVRSRCQSHVLQMMLPSSHSVFTSLAKRLLSTDQRLWHLVKGAEAGQWAQEWNQEVERFLGEKRVKEYLEGVWRIHGNVPTELRSILTHFLSKLDHKLAHARAKLGSNGVPRLEFSDLRPRESHLTRDVTLKHLSTVELAVLVSCKHLSASTLDFQSGFNLEMAYSEYIQWTKSLEARGKRVGKGAMSRDAFCSAFDTLRRTELILPLSTTSTIPIPSSTYLAPARSIPFKMHRLVPRPAEVALEVEKRKDIDSELRKWASA